MRGGACLFSSLVVVSALAAGGCSSGGHAGPDGGASVGGSAGASLTGGASSAGHGSGNAGAGGATSSGGGTPASAGGRLPTLDAATPSGGGASPEAGIVEPPAGPEGPNAEAFDRATGMLNVDYASFLSKHDVVYRQPNTNPIAGLTVGNGKTGAMVWSANGLTLQVSGVDTSEQTAFSSGLVTLQTTPALDANAGSFEQRLSLHDGTLTTTYGTDRTVTVLGVPGSEMLGIHVEDHRSGVSSVSLDLGIWDLSNLANSGAVPDLGTWKTLSTFADADGAGLSRGQTDANHFGYTLAATVEGTTFTTAKVGNDKVRLTIAPSQSFTIWLTATSRLDAANNDSVAGARAALADAKRAGYAANSAGYTGYWHDFWSRSFVEYESASDYLENVYYLSTYMIAAGGSGRYPFHFINGVFRATGDDTKWSNAYWYWNQRDVYASFLASNHADLLHVFNGMYSGNADALRKFTQAHYGVAGIWVPETMGWNGNADGTTGSDYTKNIYSTGVEAANNMYAEYRYTGDDAYLMSTVYPFMRDVANFYVGKLSHDGGSGQYSMASSNAHETYWNVPDAITDLAAIRSLFPLAIATSTTLGADADARAKWQDVVDHLVPYPADDTNYLPHQPPIAQTRNDENVACELIWPYSVTGIGAPDYARAVSTWKSRPFPYGNVWANDAIQAARLGLGDDALKGMITMLKNYQSYPNGMTNNTNGVFEYLGVHLSVMNEALLQSQDDHIRVFPAMPTDASYVGRFTLLARGGFLVSAEKEGTDVKYVGLKSTRGGTATLVNPWGTEPVQVRHGTDVVLTASSAELSVPTDAGGIYVVERVAKPLDGYAYAKITGTRNTTAKSLGGTPCTLGLAAK
ncbi:MAG TPA: hypothetical protein VH062_16990 [Polyangiaceae bacterium]|jgi:hypothetical protein|nr:hypothetical protein [Polyangiaceae bacterium]